MRPSFERYLQLARKRDNYCYQIVGALRAHVEMLRKNSSPQSVAYSLDALTKFLAEYDAINTELEAADAADAAAMEAEKTSKEGGQ
jgi:hypothetical protein